MRFLCSRKRLKPGSERSLPPPAPKRGAAALVVDSWPAWAPPKWGSPSLQFGGFTPSISHIQAGGPFEDAVLNPSSMPRALGGLEDLEGRWRVRFRLIRLAADQEPQPLTQAGLSAV